MKNKNYLMILDDRVEGTQQNFWFETEVELMYEIKAAETAIKKYKLNQEIIAYKCPIQQVYCFVEMKNI